MKIFVAIDLPQTAVNKLQETARGHELTFRTCTTAEELAIHFARETEVLLTRVLPDPSTTPGLKWLQTCGAGVDHLLSHPLCKPPLKITTASGIHSESVAELVFASILYFQRNLRKIQTYRALRKWPELAEHYGFFDRPPLSNQTLGVVGFGAIGQAVARIGSGFGMKVLALRRHPGRHSSFHFRVSSSTWFLPSRVYGPEDLTELATVSDFLVLCLPLTDETRHLINQDFFRQMKPSSILVNVGRGAVVDEEALVGALRENRIRGAALDVYEREPLPRDHPFYSMENVFLSPHVGGARSDYDSMVAEVFAANLTRYLAGEPLLNEVNWDLAY